MRIGVRQKLYNAEIRNRREALGLSQKQLAEKVGISALSVSAAENLRILGGHSKTIARLAAFFGVGVDVICPPWLRMMAAHPTDLDIQGEMTPPMLAAAAERLHGLGGRSIDEEIDASELSKRLRGMLHLVTPRERRALEMRFGLDGTPEKFLEEIGDELGVTRERARQIIVAGVRKLRGKAALEDAARLRRDIEDRSGAIRIGLNETAASR